MKRKARREADSDYDSLEDNEKYRRIRRVKENQKGKRKRSKLTASVSRED